MTRVFLTTVRLLAALGILFSSVLAYAEDPSIEEMHRKYRIRIVGPEWAVPGDEEEVPAPPSLLSSPKFESLTIEVPKRPAPPPYRFSTITFGTGLSYSALSVIDRGLGGTALFLSDLNYRFNMIWHQVWSREWRSFGMLEISRVDYSLGTLGYTILDSSHFYSGFGVGIEHKLRSGLALGLNVGVRQETFVIAESDTVLRVTSMAVPRLGLAARWILIPLDPFGVSLETKASAMLPTQTPYGQGILGKELGIKLKFEQQRPSDRLGLGFFYTVKQYGAQVESLTERELGIEFEFRFTLGKESAEGTNAPNPR